MIGMEGVTLEFLQDHRLPSAPLPPSAGLHHGWAELVVLRTLSKSAVGSSDCMFTITFIEFKPKVILGLKQGGDNC